MKTYNSIQILEPNRLDLKIDQAVADTLGLRSDVLLTGFALGLPKDKREEVNDLSPARSIVLAFFPLASWGRLLRASLTYKPSVGSMARLVDYFNRLGLICHHVETTNGLDLGRYDVLSSERKRGDLPRLLEERSCPASSYVIPTTYVYFEVGPEGEHPELREVLLGLAKNVSTYRGHAERLLQEALKVLSGSEGETPEDDWIRVDWVSPMESLNRLGSWNPSQAVGEDEAADCGGLADENRHLRRARARKKVKVVADAAGALTVSLAPWQRLIWPHHAVIPDELSWQERGPILVLGHADANEKVLVWDLFYSPEDAKVGNPVIEFEVLHPGGLLEPLWWRWILDEVSKANGNVLTGRTSARFEGQWTVFRAVAIFPLDYSRNEGERGDIKCILDCFRTLQGAEGERANLLPNDKDREELPASPFSGDFVEKELKPAAERLEGKPAPRTESTLRRVRVWDPRRDTVERDYSDRFKANPFSFTRPLDLESYDALYPLEEEQRSRRTLAIQVAQRLRQGENIAIVGAHRSGKTSVLNMVEGHLKQSLEEQDSDLVLVPVPLSAALVPPQALFPFITLRLSEIANEMSQQESLAKLGKELARGTRKAVRATTRGLLSVASMVNVEVEGFRVGLTPPSLPPSEGNKKLSEDLEKLLWFTENMTSDKALDFMRQCLKILQSTLSNVSERVVVVVILDEIGRLTGSEFKAVLQGWRHVIESKDFDAIRWLISTSRPIEENKEMSPITNVFKEYNVGNLRKEEAEKFMRIFSLPDAEDQAKLRPVLTYHAGVFVAEFCGRLPYFLQVVCYHLFDRSRRSYLPIINTDMSQRVIRREVLGEVSDYLEFQWGWVPESVQEKIVRTLRGAPRDPVGLTRHLRSERFRDSLFPASYRKAMTRAGLKGGDQQILAPVVAFWLMNQEADERLQEVP